MENMNKPKYLQSPLYKYAVMMSRSLMYQMSYLNIRRKKLYMQTNDLTLGFSFVEKLISISW